jgi:hypothetical protein
MFDLAVLLSAPVVPMSYQMPLSASWPTSRTGSGRAKTSAVWIP